ncbi:magnesium protoporphyrin IX methyltransferase [Piscinibacter defluvii]|uniref:magnesium protoporphyrin IX methyltransferase n=1 Tax=Piscinibacter defluvii TaxID=1796922 RepID=UPI000FDEA70D|nr:magnesium protoporphyrin IX methyltransferase [Piscinibacter defluvii]
MEHQSYTHRRGEIEHYFDRTAVQAWARLTSDAPVGRIRATVRAGRERMRATLLDWLPEDLHGARILDAGCGTGAFAVAAARRGASVLAIDLSATLVELAWQRLAQHLDVFGNGGHIEFRAGDMLSAELGTFDHVVAMDSLIHYETADAVRALSAWAPRVRGSMLFTFAPRTPALAAMHAVGRWFPRGDRAPAIEPVAEGALRRELAQSLPQWHAARSARVASGFYTSQAMELRTT